MKHFSENSIENLKLIAKDSDLEVWKRNNYFKSVIDILERNQEEFERWVKLFIQNHKCWLTKSRYSDNLENCFDSEFERCLDKLEEPKFKNIINSIEDLRNDESNITISIFLLEAARFGYIVPNEEILKHETIHQRHINTEIQEVFELHFPDSYQQHIGLRYDRMLYSDFEENENNSTPNFGGPINHLKKEGVNRLITIDPIPKSLKINSVSKITIAFNFDKAFWIPINMDSEYFIQHDKEGEPTKEINTITNSEIEYYKENPLHTCYVQIKRTPDKYIHHHSSKNEWRIGGMPNWVQKPQEVSCPTCQEKMKFIIQLPSGDLKDIKNEGVYYGSDGGTTYGFWCDRDQIMGYIWQDT